MNFKKITAGIAACIIALTLTGCEKDKGDIPQSKPKPVESASSTAEKSSASTTTAEAKPVEKPVEKKELPEDVEPTVYLSALKGEEGNHYFVAKQAYEDMSVVGTYKEDGSGNASLDTMVITCGSYSLESIVKKVDQCDPSEYKKDGDTYVRENINQSMMMGVKEVYAMMALAAASTQYGDVGACAAKGYWIGPDGEKVPYLTEDPDKNNDPDGDGISYGDGINDPLITIGPEWFEGDDDDSKPTQGDDFTASTEFDIAGDKYGMGCTIQDFLDNGWTWSKKPDVTSLKGHSQEYITDGSLVNGDAKLGVKIANTSDDTLPIEECYIGELSLRESDYAYTSIIGGFLNLHRSTSEDVINTMTHAGYTRLEDKMGDLRFEDKDGTIYEFSMYKSATDDHDMVTTLHIVFTDIMESIYD